MNIILVTIDCFRYDRCSFNGYTRQTTPVLSDLASESAIFDNAFTTGPYTPESFPGLFAGLHSRQTPYLEGSYIFKTIPTGAETLASELHDHGYDTTATISNSHLTTSRNFDHGFGSFENIRVETDAERTTKEESSPSVEDILNRVKSSLVSDRGSNPISRLLGAVGYAVYRRIQYPDGWPSVSGQTVVDEFLDSLDDVQSPFFGWTHLMDLHAPLHPKPIIESKIAPTRSVSRALYWDGIRSTQIETPHYGQLYNAMLRHVDSLVGYLIKRLKSRDIWEDTVLIITGDHGEALFDRGTFGHGQNYLFDEVQRVPLLVRAPGLDSKRITRQFSLAWMHELISEVADLPKFDIPLSGRKSHLANAGKEGIVICDSINKYGHTISVRDGQKKYISHNPASGWNDPPRKSIGPLNGEVMYRTHSDPGECDACPTDLATELRRKALEMVTMPEELPTVGDSVPDDIKDNLEDLGYVM